MKQGGVIMSSDDWEHLDVDTNPRPTIEQKKIELKPLGQCCENGMILAEKDGLRFGFKCGCCLGQKYALPQWFENNGYTRIESS